jgi:hypothetical protein
MWPHFVNLLLDSWHNVLAALSTSTLAIILFSLAAPIVTFVITLGVVSKLNAEKTFMEHLRQSVIPTLIGFAVPLVLLICVFSWKVVETVYNDHQVLADRVNGLITENQNIKDHPQVITKLVPSPEKTTVIQPQDMPLEITTKEYGAWSMTRDGKPALAFFIPRNDE